MPAIVNSVKENSIAEELEIQTGDILVSIDEQKVKYIERTRALDTDTGETEKGINVLNKM